METFLTVYLVIGLILGTVYLVISLVFIVLAVENKLEKFLMSIVVFLIVVAFWPFLILANIVIWLTTRWLKGVLGEYK